MKTYTDEEWKKPARFLDYYGVITLLSISYIAVLAFLPVPFRDADTDTIIQTTTANLAFQALVFFITGPWQLLSAIKNHRRTSGSWKRFFGCWIVLSLTLVILFFPLLFWLNVSEMKNLAALGTMSIYFIVINILSWRYQRMPKGYYGI